MRSLNLSCLEIAVRKVYSEVKEFAPEFNWLSSSETKLWNELVACILGSQVRYELSLAAVKYLGACGLLKIGVARDDCHDWERKVAHALSQPIFPSRSSLSISRYRFPKLRANQIRRTYEEIYFNRQTIKNLLHSSENEKNARLRISTAGVGVGPKQASLFLRNVGFAESLAILDSHVIKYMNLLGLLNYPVRYFSSVSEYEKVEEKLLRYADSLHATVAGLDTSIWVVMRVYEGK